MRGREGGYGQDGGEGGRYERLEDGREDERERR